MHIMDPITTDLTRLLDINTPIVSAAMAAASGGQLAAAVTLGGGFGFMSAGASFANCGRDTPCKQSITDALSYLHLQVRMSPETLQHELSSARSLLRSDQDHSLPLSIGVGFLGWALELPDSPDVNLLSIALKNNVKALWFAFGLHTERWLRLVRDHDQKSGANRKTLLFVQISSLDEAKVAIFDWRVDTIVAQGNEAGGHGRSSALPLLSLVPSITSILPKPGPILLAAGGLANGAHVAALLTLGAAGVVLGTRFLLTPESLYSDVQKQALIDANSTVRTMAFDHVRGTLQWPSGVDGRALYNLTVEEFDKGVELDQLKRRYSAEDPNRVVVWSGTGVTLMSVVKPAKEVVLEIHQECVACLRAAQTFITVR